MAVYCRVVSVTLNIFSPNIEVKLLYSPRPQLVVSMGWSHLSLAKQPLAILQMKTALSYPLLFVAIPHLMMVVSI